MTRNVKNRARLWLLAGLVAAGVGIAPALTPAAHAQSKEPIKIGFGMALTGGLAGAGKAALISMQIWAEDVNKAGGLLGRPVELVYYDDQTNPATVPGLYAKLLDVDKVDFVVSGYGTNLIAPALPIVIQRGKVFMGLFGVGNNEEYKYDRYFQILPAGPDPRRGVSEGFLKLAKEQGLKKIAIVAADAEYAQNVARGAREASKEMGFEIVYDKSYPPTNADFSPIIRAINATEPDMVFAASYPPDSVGLVRALSEIGPADSMKMFGGGMVGLQYASIANTLGEKMNGIINYDYYVAEKTVSNPEIDALLAKYRPIAREQGVDPLGQYLPPWSYTYLQILGTAINATGSLDDKVLADYIHKTTFDTVIGKVTFDSHGEWVKPRVLFVQYKGLKEGSATVDFDKPGARQILYPPEFATGTWMSYQDGKKFGN